MGDYATDERRDESLARDASGVTRLTDAEALALAEEWGNTIRIRIGSLADTQDVAELKAIVRYVLAVAPVVAAAREFYRQDSRPTTHKTRIQDRRTAMNKLLWAARALDGDA